MIFKIFSLVKLDNGTSINQSSITLNRDEFERLTYKFNSFVLLNNYENARKVKQPNVKNKYVDMIFKAICKVLSNQDNLKHFTDDNNVTFVLLKSQVEIIDMYRNHFDVLYRIFDYVINHNNITYNDDKCEVSYDVI